MNQGAEFNRLGPRPKDEKNADSPDFKLSIRSVVCGSAGFPLFSGYSDQGLPAGASPRAPECVLKLKYQDFY